MLSIRIFLLVMLLALPTLQTENIYKILPKGRNTRKLVQRPDFTITNTDNDATLENFNLSDKQRKFLKYMFDYPDISNILPDEENPDSIALKKYFETHHTPLATIISKFFGRNGNKVTNKDRSLEAIAIGDVPMKINSKEQEFLNKKKEILANKIGKEYQNNIFIGKLKTNPEVEEKPSKTIHKKEDSTILDNIIPHKEKTKIISVIHPAKTDSKPIQEQDMFVQIPAEERKIVPETITVIQEKKPHKIAEAISSNGEKFPENKNKTTGKDETLAMNYPFQEKSSTSPDLLKETPKNEKLGQNHIKNENSLLEKQIKPLEIKEPLAKTNPPQKEDASISAKELPEKEISVKLSPNHIKNKNSNKSTKETSNQKPLEEIKFVHNEDLIEKDEIEQHRPIVVLNQVTGVPEIHVPVTIVEEKPVEKVTQKPEVNEFSQDQKTNSKPFIFSATKSEKDQPKPQIEEKLIKNEVKDILSTKYDTPVSVPEKNKKSEKGSKHQERFLFFNDDKSEENFFDRKHKFGGRNNKGVIEIDYVSDMNAARHYKHLDEYSGEKIHGIVPHSNEDTLEVGNEPVFQKKIIRFPGDRSHERIPVDEPVVMKAHFEALTSSNSEEELLVQPIKNKKKPKYPVFSKTSGRNFERMLDLPEINQLKSDEQQSKSKVNSEAKYSTVNEKKTSNVEATMSNQSATNENAIMKTAISPETNISKSANSEIIVPNTEKKTHKFSAKFVNDEKLSGVEKEGNVSKEAMFTLGNDPKVPKVPAKKQNTSHQNPEVVPEEKVGNPLETKEDNAPVVSKEKNAASQNPTVVSKDKIGKPLEGTEVKTSVPSKVTNSSKNSTVVPEAILGKPMEIQEIKPSNAFLEHEKAFEEKQQIPAEKERMFSIHEEHNKNKINKDEQRIQPKVSSEKENEEILIKIEQPSSINGSKLAMNKSEDQHMEPRPKSKTEEGPKSLNKSNVFHNIPKEKIAENITKTADMDHPTEAHMAIAKPEVVHQKEKTSKTLNKTEVNLKIHKNLRTAEENISKSENISKIKDIINVSISEDNNGSPQEVIPTLKTIFHEETESSEEIPIKISHPREFSRRKGGFQTLREESRNNQDVVPTLKAIFAESNGSSGENWKMKASPEQMDRLFLPKEDIRQIFEAKFEESNESSVEKLDKKLPKSNYGNQKPKHTLETRFEESNESLNGYENLPKRLDRLFFPKEIKPTWDTRFVDSNESSEEVGIKAAKRIPIKNIIREEDTKKTSRNNASLSKELSSHKPGQKHPQDLMEKTTNVVKNTQNKFFREVLNSSAQQESKILKPKEEIVPQNDSKKMSGTFQKEVSEKKLTEDDEKDQKLQEIGRKLKVLQALLKIKQSKKDANVDNILMRMNKLRKVQRQLNNPVIWPVEEKSEEPILSVENKSVAPKLQSFNKFQKENKEDYFGMRDFKPYVTPEQRTWSKIIQEEEIKKSFDYFQNPSMYGNFQPKPEIFEETFQKDIRPIYDTSTFPGFQDDKINNFPIERKKPNDFPLNAFRKEFEAKSSKEDKKIWKNKKEKAIGKILDSIEEIDSFKEEKSSGVEKNYFNKKPAGLGNEFLETILKVKNEDVKKEEIPKVSTEVVKPKHDIEAIFFKEMKDKMENRQKLHQILEGIQNKDDASEEDVEDVLIPSKKTEKLNYEKPKKIGVIENIYGLDQAFGESRHENKENMDISSRKIIGSSKKHNFENFRSSGLDSRTFNEKSSRNQENIEELPKVTNKASGMVASSNPEFHFFREENIEELPKKTINTSGNVPSSNPKFPDFFREENIDDLPKESINTSGKLASSSPQFRFFREENIEELPKESINTSGKVASSNPEFRLFREDNIEELSKDSINISGKVATSNTHHRHSIEENVSKFDKVFQEKEKTSETKVEHIPKKKISYSKYKNEDLEDLPRLLSKTTEVEEVSKFDEIFEDKEKSPIKVEDKIEDHKKSSFFNNQETSKPKQVNFEAFEAQSAEEVDVVPKMKNRVQKMEEFGFNKNDSFDRKEKFDKYGNLYEENNPKKKNDSAKGKSFGKYHVGEEKKAEKIQKDVELENISQFDKVFEDLSGEDFEDFPKTKVDIPKMTKHSFEEHKMIKNNGKVSKFDKIFPGKNDEEILKKKALEDVSREDLEDFPKTRMVPPKMKKHSSEDSKSIEVSGKVPKIAKLFQEEDNGEIFTKKNDDFLGKDLLIDQAMVGKELNYSKYEKILEEKRKKLLKDAQETVAQVEGSSSNHENIFSDEISKKDENIEQPKTIVEKESRYIPPRFRVAKFTNPRSNEDFNKHLHIHRPSYFDLDKMTEKEHRIEKELHRRNTNHHKYFENPDSNMKIKRKKRPLELEESRKGTEVEKTHTFSDDSDKFVYVKDKRDKYQFVVKAKPIEQNVRTASTKIKIIKDVPEKVIKDVAEDDLNTDFLVNVKSQAKSSTKKSRKNNYVKVPFPENKLGANRFENMDGYSKGFKVIKATDEDTFTL